MATTSSIEWTEMTLNPVTGCIKISQGCKHCYAERMAKRLQAMKADRYRDGFQPTLHDDLIVATHPSKVTQRKARRTNKIDHCCPGKLA